MGRAGWIEVTLSLTLGLRLLAVLSAGSLARRPPTGVEGSPAPRRATPRNPPPPPRRPRAAPRRAGRPAQEAAAARRSL